MTHQEFQTRLWEALSTLPPIERQKAADYYNELILDAIENGGQEEEVIASLGSIEEIRDKTLVEYGQSLPYSNSRNTLRTTLTAIGLPFAILIGIPLAAAALALYLSGWAVIASLWVSAAAMAACLPLGILSGCFLFSQSVTAALFQMGAGVLTAGLGLLLGAGMLALTRLYIRFTRWLWRSITGLFHKKGAAPAGVQPGEI